MLIRLAYRIVRSVHPRLLWRLALVAGWRNMRAIERFKRSLAKTGKAFPPFLFFSITNRCNLRCQGCWVTPSKPAAELSAETLDRMICECKAQGSYFFGILGGEPLLHPALFDIMAKHPDCYFQIFTNGTQLTDAVALRLRQLGNVTPLISIEGLGGAADVRRGGHDVTQQAEDALESCHDQRLFTGVATSVCKSNIDDLLSEKFLEQLIDRGVHYMWYYIYRPVGPDANPALALSEAEILRVRRFLVEMRTKAPIILIDAYWDADGRALCPAAMGISHHINPAGDIEPCPPIQFAKDRIDDGRPLEQVLRESQFLAHFREKARATSRGCMLLEDPDSLFHFLKSEQATDTTGRGTGFRELEAMEARPGHDLPGKELREKSWVYRFAKRRWFFGFGAYG